MPVDVAQEQPSQQIIQTPTTATQDDHEYQMPMSSKAKDLQEQPELTALQYIALDAKMRVLDQVDPADGSDKDKFDNWLWDVEQRCLQFHIPVAQGAARRARGQLADQLQWHVAAGKQ